MGKKIMALQAFFTNYDFNICDLASWTWCFMLFLDLRAFSNEVLSSSSYIIIKWDQGKATSLYMIYSAVGRMANCPVAQLSIKNFNLSRIKFFSCFLFSLNKSVSQLFLTNLTNTYEYLCSAPKMPGLRSAFRQAKSLVFVQEPFVR